jgi:nucleoid-associated protein YgaU
MGLFDFVKNAGDKIFGSDDNNEDVTTVSPERINELRQERITKMIKEAGLEIDELSVVADDALVTLKGNVKVQSDSEKATLIAGNQFGISKVDNQLKIGTNEAEATFYTVKSGDTLSAIAKDHYGSANKYMAIFKANEPMLTDPNKIYPGQVLRIPAQ